MSITSAKTGATGISLALENNFMEPIASTLVGAGGVNTVIFNDIPQGYKHLQLRILTRASDSANMAGPIFRLNGDFASNYSYHLLTGNGASIGAAGVANASFMHFENVIANTGIANSFGVYIIDILDYANTNKYKTARTLHGWDNNGSGTTYGQVGFHSANWRANDPVTQITASMFTSSSFMQYSRFSLYGIKG